MTRFFKTIAACSAALCLAVPAAAQEAEEARTTYEVRFLDLAPGADNEWMELFENTFAPARRAAGLPVPTVHWLMTGPWDIMMLIEMPDGMATMDSHNPPTGTAFRQALQTQVGSEEALEELFKKTRKLVKDARSYYSHTHP